MKRQVKFTSINSDTPYDTGEMWTLARYELERPKIKYETVDLPLTDGQTIFSGYGRRPLYNNNILHISLESSEADYTRRQLEIDTLFAYVSSKQVNIESSDTFRKYEYDSLLIQMQKLLSGWMTDFDIEFNDVNHCRVNMEFSVNPKYNGFLSFVQYFPTFIWDEFIHYPYVKNMKIPLTEDLDIIDFSGAKIRDFIPELEANHHLIALFDFYTENDQETEFRLKKHGYDLLSTRKNPTFDPKTELWDDVDSYDLFDESAVKSFLKLTSDGVAVRFPYDRIHFRGMLKQAEIRNLIEVFGGKVVLTASYQFNGVL